MNTNKMKFGLRELVSIAVMTALGVVLAALIHFPLIPAAPFLEYDPADIPIFIVTFAYGPVAGLISTVLVSVIQGLTVSAGSGWIGIIMHIAATGTFALIAGNIYRVKKTRKRAAIAIILGVVSQTAVMVVCNLIFTPIFMGTPIEAVVQMIIPVLLPFNLLKSGINGAITFALYKHLAKFLKRESSPRKH